ncbi:hypothetical protein [Klebsiella phage 05F01]|nr:hypothetical protein [Klebsiella phage 05F01]
MLFSPKNQAFYSEELEYSTLPSDLVTIDEKSWIDYLSKINEGYFVYLSEDTLTVSDDARPSILYSFDTDTKTWIQSEEQKAEQVVLDKKSRLEKAKSLYYTTTNELTEYGYMIEDKDYSDYSEDKLLDIKSQLTSYRIALRAYINTDGSGEVPYYETT